MLMKTTVALQALVDAHPFLAFGLSHRLFNLTQLAHYLCPLVEARAQKSIKPTALVTALSRLQKQLLLPSGDAPMFRIEKLSITADLATATYYKNQLVHDRIGQVSTHIRDQNGLFHFTESTNEISVFLERSFLDVLMQQVPEKPRYLNTKLACVGVRFGAEHVERPGLLFALFQRIYLQNINIVDISSTYTELNFYIHREHLKLVFETLHDCFLRVSD